MEPSDNYFIEPLKPFLKFIPKPYYADCCACVECAGLNYCLYDEFEFPSDTDLLHEISKSHLHVKNRELCAC